MRCGGPWGLVTTYAYDEEGCTVSVTDGPVTPVKVRLGVPRDLASCHTAQVGGYVVEGHVPAEAIKRLLAEKPEGIGLAVPGMPAGSLAWRSSAWSRTPTWSSCSDRRAAAPSRATAAASPSDPRLQPLDRKRRPGAEPKVHEEVR